MIPDAVWQEVVEQGTGKPGVADLRNAAWLERRSIENKEMSIALQDSLDAGESEAIALAIGVKADLLLMDERLGRLMARRLKLNVIGVAGVLIEAKHKGLIALIKPILDQLRDEVGFRLSDALYQQILLDQNETD